MNDELLKEFEAVSKPLIEWLNKLHPHHSVIVTATSAELVEGKGTVNTNEFLKD